MYARTLSDRLRTLAVRITLATTRIWPSWDHAKVRGLSVLPICGLAVALGLASSEALAQADTVPVGDFGWCGFTGFTVADGTAEAREATLPVAGPRVSPLPPSPDKFVRRMGGDLCYALSLNYNNGWKAPMQLYLAKGAKEYLAEIKRAADAWNRLLPVDMIVVNEDEISKEYEVAASLPGARSFYRDGTSVLYLTDRGYPGYAHAYQRYDPETKLNSIVEADVFIRKEPFVISAGSLQATIIHELGHALGLGHLSVSGSIMSYAKDEDLEDVYEPFLKLGLLPPEYGTELHGSNWGYFYMYYSQPGSANSPVRILGPTEIDKLILSCLYDQFKPQAPADTE